MSPKIRNPEYPDSPERLVALCKTWDFHDDLWPLETPEGERAQTAQSIVPIFRDPSICV